MNSNSRIPIAMTIAGSDSGGGAGIQADLKTFSALGVYGASVITALTAQNTQGVTGIHDTPPDFITAQLDAVFDDLDVKAVKIGMVSRTDAITAIADSRVTGCSRPTRSTFCARASFRVPSSSHRIFPRRQRCSICRLPPPKLKSKRRGKSCSRSAVPPC
jgi:hypothetical protein